MGITEQSRKRMYQLLEEVLGEGAAGTLMEHLPPVGWADVATKHELAGVEARLSAQCAHLREVMELRFQAAEDTFLSKATFYRVIAAQTLALMGFTAALIGVLR